MIKRLDTCNIIWGANLISPCAILSSRFSSHYVGLRPLNVAKLWEENLYLNSKDRRACECVFVPSAVWRGRCIDRLNIFLKSLQPVLIISYVCITEPSKCLKPLQNLGEYFNIVFLYWDVGIPSLKTIVLQKLSSERNWATEFQVLPKEKSLSLIVSFVCPVKSFKACAIVISWEEAETIGINNFNSIWGNWFSNKYR